MDLLCACFPQEPHNAGTGGAPDDGIVDHDDRLTRNRFTDRVQLDFYLVFTGGLVRCNEGAGDIAIFDEAGSIWNVGCLGISKGRNPGHRSRHLPPQAGFLQGWRLLFCVLHGR